MNRNLVGSIYGRASKKIVHDDPLTNMAAQTILVSDWSISKSLLL
jgi:hypothetical protein